MRGIWGLVSSNRGVILGGLQIRHDGLNVFFSAFVRRVFLLCVPSRSGVCQFWQTSALEFFGVHVLLGHEHASISQCCNIGMLYHLCAAASAPQVTSLSWLSYDAEGALKTAHNSS